MSDSIKLIQEYDISVIKPEGEIVFENSNKIKERTKEILEENEINKLIIDLKSVPYLDSSGVGVIISLFKYLRERKGKLAITNLQPKVKRVCELTKLNEIINIFESNEKAVKELSTS
ncbi:MAG: STAS domain-containing protein [Halanaerobiales bacterium]